MIKNKIINKILIITTEGCEGCAITKGNIYAAETMSSRNFEIEVKDWHDAKRAFLIQERVKDYPTVFYMINERIVHKAVGTYPTAVYLRWIDIYFKN